LSGHSKWATTKHKKAAIDAKRGKLFAKLIKNIEVAARVGGGDLSGNPTLYDAVQKAKKNSVPADNIERAVKRGSGAGADAVNYDTIMYEAYGPASVAILIECLTDNRNRAFADVRVAVTRNGGTLADGGSVQRLFSRKGVIEVAKKQEGGKTLTEDDLLEATMDAMPESIDDEGEGFSIITEASDLVEVRKAIQAAGVDYESADVAFVASFDQSIESVEQALKLEKIIDALEDSDDVQNVYTNAKYSEEVQAALEEED
jgi:YebC/PmpR family DNA-binding regulatory protein